MSDVPKVTLSTVKKMQALILYPHSNVQLFFYILYFFQNAQHMIFIPHTQTQFFVKIGAPEFSHHRQRTNNFERTVTRQSNMSQQLMTEHDIIFYLINNKGCSEESNVRAVQVAKCS